jgi:hypothetical protein
MKTMAVEAYWEVLEDRTLEHVQREVATEVARHDSMTGRELDEALRSSSAHKRLAGLGALGVLYVKSVRACRVTGRNAKAWAMTGKKAEKAAQKSPAVNRPTKVELTRCLPSLRKLYLTLTHAKDPSAEDIKKLGLWISAITESEVPTVVEVLPPPVPPKEPEPRPTPVWSPPARMS